MSDALQALVHADPWARDLVDLPSLNARASDAIVATIEWVRTTALAAPSALRGRSMVVLGPAGAGKTHMFARLRRKVGPRAIFVHVRPLIGAEMTPRYLLREIVAQLAFDTHGFRQTDALVGSLVGHLDGGPTYMPRAFIEVLTSLGKDDREERLEEVIELVTERWPQVDDIYLRKLLRTPFVPSIEQRALLAWLSGREPDEAQLARIGARDGLQDELIMPALKTLGAVAAPGAPIVIVFDQLENLIDAEGANRVRAYGNLVAELVDEVRGVVIVQMALDTEWARAIEPELATSQKTRAAMERLTLELPSAVQREDLLRLWSARVPGHEPFPAPFGAERVHAWCTEPGLTPRGLLIKCMSALDGAPEPSEPSNEPHDELSVADAVEQAWRRHLEGARAMLDEAVRENRCAEAELLADGFAAAARFVDRIRVVSTSHMRPAQVIVDRGKDRVHLALLTKSHPRSVTGTMDAIARLAERELVLMVRELAQSFPPTWKASIARRDRLLQLPRVQWLDLEREDAARLLALRALVADARSRDVADLEGKPLEEEAVRDWIAATLEVSKWTPVRAVLEFEASQTKARAEEPAIAPEPERSVAGPPPSSAPVSRPPASGSGGALEVLLRLRVASVDRVVREVTRMRPSTTRATVLAELQRAKHSVRWFGRTVVAWQDGES